VVRFTLLPLYPRGKSPGTHWIGGWVYPRTGLDMEKRKFLPPPGLELRTLSRPARSQSLYRLRYSGSYILIYIIKITTTILICYLNLFIQCGSSFCRLKNPQFGFIWLRLRFSGPTPWDWLVMGMSCRSVQS
jgi:hypothetical protein